MDNFSLSKLRGLLPSLPLLSPTTDEGFEQKDPMDDTTPGNDKVQAQASQEDPPKTAAETDPSNDVPTVLDPQPIDESKPKTNLDLINEVDSFPYFQTHPNLYLKHINTYYAFRSQAYPDTTLGYILPSVATILNGISGWKIDDDERTLTLVAGSNEEERSAVVAATTAAMRATGYFSVLKGWRNELYPVYGPAPKKELLFSIERSASALFGVVSYGVHMTAYTYVSSATEETTAEEEEEKQTNDEAEGEEKPQEAQNTSSRKQRQLKLWIPRRAATKQTYGGMLDNSVAGGMATGEKPLECVIREASEEASLPSDLVRAAARPAGTVSYFHIRDRRAGGETNLLQPEIQFVYDLELPEDVRPKPCDDEVERFYLLSVDECKEKLAKGEFKPNCAAVLLDFFVRWGFLTAEEEGDYVDIVSRLHRKFEFPTM